MKFFTSLLLLCATCNAFIASSNNINKPSFVSARSNTKLMASEFAVIVEADIVPERMDEFLEMIKTNAENTRKEPACIRFDVLRSQDDPNKFFFYELYESIDAIAYHKEQDHYKAWVTFKESGGVVESVTKKMDGEYLP